MIIRLILPSTVLFFLGAVFAYLFILPFSIDFLYKFAAAMGVEQLFTIDKFISFVLMMTLAFGVIAKLPVIIVGLSSLGIVSPQFWVRNWQWAALLSMIFAAIITPDGTGITMIGAVLPVLNPFHSLPGASWSHLRPLSTFPQRLLPEERSHFEPSSNGYGRQ